MFYAILRRIFKHNRETVVLAVCLALVITAAGIVVANFIFHG